MSSLLERCAYVIEELGQLYDAARAQGFATIQTAVGATFEKRVRGLLRDLEAAGIDSDVPPADDHPETTLQRRN